MKIDIIVVYVQRYEKGHEFDFVPPTTGVHLAALTETRHDVRVFHEQVDVIDYETDADLVAISFFSGFAREAYRLADVFRSRGRQVVMGGPHVTYAADEALAHCDAVVIGEAEQVWTRMIDDAEARRLARVYEGATPTLEGQPTPRYDLLSERFFIKRVIQATRGCPFHCSFCTVPTLNPGFRMRPVAEVMKDVAYDDFPHWWQRKIVWFWDDNLTIDRPYAKALLGAMIPQHKWWLTQASLDIAKDPELLDLMQASGCIGIFLGIETFGDESLVHANKRQNKIRRYEEAISELHRRGICVMAGFISGFDGDTPESIEQMADNLYAIGVDVPFLSILTPFPGTPLYDEMVKAGRMRKDVGWECFNGYNVAFEPKRMTPNELYRAHRALWNKAFSFRHSAGRLLRAARYLRPGALMMAACMNGFYWLKQARGNTPADMSARTDSRSIPVHVARAPAVMEPVRIRRRA
jgi:radical SAM superfamily enzyme YgiQ (UPF0313 family)